MAFIMGLGKLTCEFPARIIVGIKPALLDIAVFYRAARRVYVYLWPEI
jgi:hypothetical protein